MKILNYESKYLVELINLFHDTVENVNIKDYTLEQVKVWVNKEQDKMFWDDRFLKTNTYLISIKDVIVGFGNIDESGYIDMFYVHKDYQGIGVGTKLLEVLETSVNTPKYITDSSITALNFFINNKYQIIKEQLIIKNNVSLINYKMTKEGI